VFAKAVSESIDPDEVISIDESAIQYETPPRMGYAPKGTRLNCPTMSSHPKKWSILLAVSKTHGVVESLLVDGAIDSGIFAKFVAGLGGRGFKHLLMDNASFHKTESVRKACRSAALSPLFLPPYTPKFQPVETCFFNLKRRMAEMPPLRGPVKERMYAVSARVQSCMDESLTAATIGNLFTKCWARMTKCAAMQTI
jgi:transposase